MANEIEDVAKTKVAGLPAWAWGTIVAVIVLVYMWFRNRNAAAAQTVTATPDVTTADLGSNTSGALPTGTIDNTAPVDEGSTNVGSDGTTPEPSWLQQALNAIESNGTPPTEGLNALGQFENGIPLTSGNAALINQALQGAGLPPDIADILSGSQGQLLAPLPVHAPVTGNAVKTPSTTVAKQQAAISNAATIANNLNRSVQTAYGWVTPAGHVTSYDPTAASKENAKQVAIKVGHAVRTAYGYETTSGVTYNTQAEANAAQAKLKK